MLRERRKDVNGSGRALLFADRGIIPTLGPPGGWRAMESFGFRLGDGEEKRRRVGV
jgi:hypothetical protein